MEYEGVCVAGGGGGGGAAEGVKVNSLIFWTN